MDLIQIGKYIAGKRKGLGLTQKQLAVQIGMSDKSVSKWEQGICLPDVSVYMEFVQEMEKGEVEENNDYVYYFTFQFAKDQPQRRDGNGKQYGNKSD